METPFAVFQSELEAELFNILDYWKNNAVDLENGGFYGKRDHHNLQIDDAPKGLVLNARILYAFSAGYRKTKLAQYLQMAQRAFHYLITYFIDKEFGGAYWALDFRGKPLDTKKQIYGIAFCIYALSEYHLAMESKEALQLSKDLFLVIEEQSHDKINGGYSEAFTRNWQPITDQRLSEKELNSAKTMNTHLHILEAYSNLYRVWPNPQLKAQIKHLIGVFQNRFVSSKHHLHLFFTNDWQLQSSLISYGHDIESSWLIWEAVELVMVEKALLKELVLSIAEASREGIWVDGSILNESDLVQKEWNRERHWWQQAEAMVGFLNAWKLSGDEKYLLDMLNVWSFIKKTIKDAKNGEWFWGVFEDGSVMIAEDKLGFWKCPYHNVRMCVEVLNRLDTIKA